jgi:GTP-binding protein
VDTGGFWTDTEEELLVRVREQAQLAIDEAQAVILVVDGMSGPTSADQEIATQLLKSGKAIFLAVNKIDSERRLEEQYFNDFFSLGFSNTFAVSAEHNRGVSDLMDHVVKALPPAPPPPAEVLEESNREDRPCRVAIVGRPNVGKSSLVNKLLGEERFVASSQPGTTTDPLDATLEYKGRHFVLTDTAGLRRKRSIALKVEQFSVIRALSAIDRADVVVLVLDATEMAVEQDARIASVALDKGKALVVFVNKWDLVQSTARADKMREELFHQMPFLTWAPVVFGSAKTGDHAFGVLSRAGEVYEHYRARLPTPQLNDFLEKVIDAHPAPLASGGHPVRLFYISQISSGPPTFAITCNRPEAVTEDYKRFIVNRMRESFGLRVPVMLLIRGRKSKRPFTPRREKNTKKKH